MRPRSVRLALAIVGAGLFLLNTSPGRACSCITSEDEDWLTSKTREAELIVAGHLLYVENEPLEDEQPVAYKRALVLVEESWKAESLRTLWVRTSWSSCGVGFRGGERWLFYLSEASADGVYPVGVCDGSHRIAEDDPGLSRLGESVSRTEWTHEMMGEEIMSFGQSVVADRALCARLPVSVEPEVVELEPGSWSSFHLRIGHLTSEWHIGQSAPGREAGDRIEAYGENASSCWLTLGADVESRWPAEGQKGSLRGIRQPDASLDAQVSPWSTRGVAVLEMPPLARRVRLSASLTPIGQVFPIDGLGSPPASSRGGISVETLTPQPGTPLGPDDVIRATIAYELPRDADPADEEALERFFVSLKFEANDGSLRVMAQGDGIPKWPVDGRRGEIDLEFPMKSTAAAGDLRRPYRIHFVLHEQHGENPMASRIVALKGAFIFPPKDGEGRVRFTGGSGESCDDAVVIEGADGTRAGIAAENRWIARHYPQAKKVGQGWIPGGDGRSYDRVTIETAAGERVEVCFDVTGFFGKIP